MITPADLEPRDPGPGRVDLRHVLQRRPRGLPAPANRSPVPGLFLVGGSAHPGGGLPLVALSARIVDSLIGPA